MLRNVQVKESSDHLLVLRVVLACFFLEKLDTGLAQTDGHLDLFFGKYQLFGRRQKVTHDLDVLDRTLSVFCFLAQSLYRLANYLSNRSYSS